MTIHDVLQDPKDCPTGLIRYITAETGILVVQKLNLAFHINGMDNSTLAKQVMVEQIKNEWPGLSKEVREFTESMDLPDILVEDTDIDINKKKWKKMVKAATKKKNTDDLKEKIKEYSKLEKIKTGKNGDIKDYLKR